MTTFAASDFFNLELTDHRIIFENTEQVWEALPKIASYLGFRLKPGIHGKLIGKPFVSTMVYVGKGTVIEQGAMIKGPAWIGENCEIRSGCYIRENVIVGDGCVLGNSCEFKNCLLFNGVQVPHFNYVGDSILGERAHLGAGVILSNVRLDNQQVMVQTSEGPVSTGLRKFGAIIGDRAEVGCNSVLNPGSIVGPHGLIYPLTSWQGVLPPNSIGRARVPLTVMPRPGGRD
jgi:UDP-N-acetylglucosamine diphosphorylase / glucose-1-phosphate thymidylyltransferase / UDP-N-acetylgalactosamine diphosphorylase / glucosamine-1-phosphate N-acetyltransferase / galactosamine-1-phosphate N-acetyltransferase